MPIKLQSELPAVKILEDENIFVMTETRAITQDIRPLKILILNLMPTKIDTETQLSRLLGNTPLQVEIELIHTSTHKSKNTSEEHLLAFYKEFDEDLSCIRIVAKGDGAKPMTCILCRLKLVGSQNVAVL